MKEKTKPRQNVKAVGKTKAKPKVDTEVLSTSFLYALVAFIVIFCAAISLTVRKNEIDNAETTPSLTQETKINADDVDFSTIPESLVNLYNVNPDARDFVLNYNTENSVPHEIDLSSYLESESVPLFMQWDKRWGYNEYCGGFAALTACGPVCLSMVAFHLKKDATLTPTHIMEFAVQNKFATIDNGSLWTLMSEGGKKLGLNVEELPLSEERVISNLKEGNPVICIMGPGNFTTTGHFIVLKDYKDGKILVNDPNSYVNSEKAWSFDEFKGEIKNMWAFSV